MKYKFTEYIMDKQLKIAKDRGFLLVNGVVYRDYAIFKTLKEIQKLHFEKVGVGEVILIVRDSEGQPHLNLWLADPDEVANGGNEDHMGDLKEIYEARKSDARMQLDVNWWYG